MYQLTLGNKVRRVVRDWAGRGGVSLVRQNGRAEQLELLADLKPVETEHELLRFGSEGDGGYLLPDDLDGIEACFSPGVGWFSDFEQAMLDRGMSTFQIDATVERSPLDHPRNVFERKLLGIETVDEFITLDDWVNEKAPGNSDLMLQIDIEGHEWLALAQVSTGTLKRFRVIAMELHYLDRLLDKFGPLVISPVLRKLRRHFDVVHIHANNFDPLVRSRDVQVPPTIEMTLLRKDRSQQRRAVSRLPHPLDTDTAPHFAPIQIPEMMYR
jgi:hypothetical protein